MKNDFSVFILSHGRAENVITYDTLKKQGYTGDIYIIIDDEDEQESLYYEKYGDMVYKFNKQKYIDTTDTMCIDEYRKIVVYARNACWDIANELGIDYFCVLDDDYKSFEYRYIENKKLMVHKFKNLDKVFDSYFSFLKKSNALTVCMAQGGDFIGGAKSANYKRRLLRKAMNAWFFDRTKEMKYIGRINEDANTYVLLGQMGKLLFTAVDCSVVQMQTQSNEGGLTDVYLNDGTYVKSFFSVMCAPSCVKVSTMGSNHRRMHHKINWECCTPKILNEKYKKV